ncbi:FAD-dependent oxidoreductase [Microbulbifer sp.]|uniref:FAD-dependent oxidoreductase n=1 Tax=Microbulbifer sp. TaxID=1908541 RepID=UPI0025893163|nr:FAD-dependent oxidoreductase [Microbulbifer sp.]
MSDFRVWECQICGWVYDEAKGSPDDGIPPGTRWEDIPDDWSCPECGATKDEFSMVAVTAETSSVQPAPGQSPAHSPARTTTTAADDTNTSSASTAHRIWECMVCGWVYDEAKGAPEEGIPAGTRWEDIPDDWTCPECGVSKEEFDMVLVSKPADEPAGDAVESPAPAALRDDLAPLVIIGTGLAGYHLAKEFRKLDQTTPVTLITADDGTSYSKPLLSASLAHGKTPAQLAGSSAEAMAAELNVDILTHTQVTEIHRTRQTVALVSHSGSIRAELRYSRLVFATGASCSALPAIEGDGHTNLFRINSLDDYGRFRTALANRKRVLLIGAGLIGCEFANDLIQAGYEVDVVDVQPWPLATLLPEAAGRDIQRALEAAGARFHFGSGVSRLERKGRGVVAQLQDGRKIEADIALAALGLTPNTGLAAAAGLTVNRGIVTDRALRTSDSNIFALGDCAEVDGHNLYFVAPLTQSARALAQTLSGTDTPVHYGCLPVAVKTTLRPTTVCPPPADSEGQWQVREHPDGVSAHFHGPDGQLLGFALTGNAITERDQLVSACRPLMD